LQSNFFPPKFPFPKYKGKIWREKITWQMYEAHVINDGILWILDYQKSQYSRRFRGVLEGFQK
jgi:hypothetical protein